MSAIRTISLADDGLPQFDSDGAMKVPDRSREWIFVGSALGPGYKDTGDSEAGAFSHVYINPFGYRAFQDTGGFPVGTVLMLEARCLPRYCRRLSARNHSRPRCTPGIDN